MGLLPMVRSCARKPCPSGSAASTNQREGSDHSKCERDDDHERECDAGVYSGSCRHVELDQWADREVLSAGDLLAEGQHDDVRGERTRVDCLDIPGERPAFPWLERDLLAARWRPVLRIDIDIALDTGHVEVG